MKPMSEVSIIFVLGMMGLCGMANGLCLVRNTTAPNQYWYHCFMSVDYPAELKRAPIDVYGHTVSNSKIQVIRNRSYIRLSQSLSTLAILYSGVEEIEDNAFQGLTNLELLALTGNKLEIMKSAWFKGLLSLRLVMFQSNRIKHMDDNMFSYLPRLHVMDVSNNQLTCLPTAAFGKVNTTNIHFRHNRLTWKCQVEVIEWLKKNNIPADNLADISSLDPPYDLVKMCVMKLPTAQLDEDVLSKCAEETTRELLPATGDYTVSQVCEFLKGKHSPFLDCAK